MKRYDKQNRALVFKDRLMDENELYNYIILEENMNYVNKLMVVLSLAVAPVVAKTPEFVKTLNAWANPCPSSIKASYDAGDYGKVATKVSVPVVAAAALGTGFYFANKNAWFNKNVTQRVAGWAKEYVSRMRKVDVPTWGLTAAVIGLGIAGWRIHQKNAALAAAADDLTAANGRSVYANLRRLAAIESQGLDVKAELQAVSDAEAAIAANKDDAKKAGLAGDLKTAQERLEAAKATHAGAYLKLVQENPAAKTDDITNITKALDTATLNALKAADAIA